MSSLTLIKNPPLNFSPNGSEVIFTRANTFSSKVTRFFTKEKWSHVGVLLGGKVYHSTMGPGCHVSSLTEFVRGTEALSFTFVPTYPGKAPGSISIEEERAIEQLGVDYDIGLLPEIATHTRDAEDFGDKSKALQRLVCSEYAEYILFGTAHSLTPGELLAIIMKSAS
jgi:hypothetical protein